VSHGWRCKRVTLRPRNSPAAKSGEGVRQLPAGAGDAAGCRASPASGYLAGDPPRDAVVDGNGDDFGIERPIVEQCRAAGALENEHAAGECHTAHARAGRKVVGRSQPLNRMWLIAEHRCTGHRLTDGVRDGWLMGARAGVPDRPGVRGSTAPELFRADDASNPPLAGGTLPGVRSDRRDCGAQLRSPLTSSVSAADWVVTRCHVGVR